MEEIENVNWNDEIEELETFFNQINKFPERIEITQGVFVMDIPAMIESHFQAVRMNNGVDTFIPYLERLKHLKKALMKVDD
ncbi:hypothetical protein GTQ40_17360 [Flavobacteriaceae bacterium R38]|nr:hypothetical protein [Flavobacteriaceae bacterium R38]